MGGRVQQLTSQDVKDGVRHIGQERLHMFVDCKHSFENGKCMLPPHHTERNLRDNSSDATVVRYRGLCSNCEERFLGRKAIVAAVKDKTIKYVKEGRNLRDLSATVGLVKWAKDRLYVQFNCESADKEKFTCPVKVWPLLKKGLLGKGAPQWGEVYMELDVNGDEKKTNTTLTYAELPITKAMEAYERKWNEPKGEDSPTILNDAELRRSQGNPSTTETAETLEDLYYQHMAPGELEEAANAGVEPWEFWDAGM